MKRILFMILACAAGAHAETKTWLGGDGNYAVPELWSEYSKDLSLSFP